MKILIKETRTIETLYTIDPFTGRDFTAEFLSGAGAKLEWVKERGAFVCDQETFDWWKLIVDAQQGLLDRIYALAQEHGPRAVFEVIHRARKADADNHGVNTALDEAFGSDGLVAGLH